MARASRPERGNVGIWGVLVFTVVGGFMALAVHTGRAYSNRGELQNGADSAALAGAAQLDGTTNGIGTAAAAAQQFGGLHYTENRSISIDPAADVAFGSWDRASRTFTPITGRTAADLREIVAVQVRDARSSLPVQFGPAFLGASTTTTVGSGAVAVGGGPCQATCAFPAAFADCLMVDPSGDLKCNQRYYVLSNDWQDNLGLTSLDPSKPASVPNIKAALQSCVETSQGEQIPITNGNPMQPISKAMTFPIEVVAPVVHVPSCPPAGYCPQTDPNCVNPKFVGSMPVRGFVSIVVCYATGSNVKQWPPNDWGPTGKSTPEEVELWNECGPAPTPADFPGVDPSKWPDPFLKQTIFLKQRCHWIDPGNQTVPGGCESFGIWTTHSRLVQ
jgi:hypothetical protein